MTNYEVIKRYSIEQMALIIMCPKDQGADIENCDGGTKNNCRECCYVWLQKDSCGQD